MGVWRTDERTDERVMRGRTNERVKRGWDNVDESAADG